jgi:hypothetical protein
MDVTALNLGSQIATATTKLVQDQQELEGQAALKLLDSAVVPDTNTASSSSGIGSQIDVSA